MLFSSDLQSRIDDAKSYKKPVTLGRITFSSALILAPMAGVTNRPFRKIMYQLGIGGAITELISSHGVSFKSKKTLKMLALDNSETTTGIQIFGEDPELLNSVAKSCKQFNPLFIDINMGCPVRKIIKRGAGSALLDHQNIQEFLHIVKNELDIPITIKIRKGFNTINAHEVILAAKNANIEFVTLHGRTAKQMYQGENDWPYIEEIAKNSPLPIIGNGDLVDAATIATKLTTTNCHALMIGRGAFYNPFIFLESYSNIKFFTKDKLEVLLALHQAFKEEDISLTIFKRHAMWMSKGMPDATNFRNTIFSLKTEQETLDLVTNFFSS